MIDIVTIADEVLAPERESGLDTDTLIRILVYMGESATRLEQLSRCCLRELLKEYYPSLRDRVEYRDSASRGWGFKGSLYLDIQGRLPEHVFPPLFKGPRELDRERREKEQHYNMECYQKRVAEAGVARDRAVEDAVSEWIRADRALVSEWQISENVHREPQIWHHTLSPSYEKLTTSNPENRESTGNSSVTGPYVCIGGVYFPGPPIEATLSRRSTPRPGKQAVGPTDDGLASERPRKAQKRYPPFPL